MTPGDLSHGTASPPLTVFFFLFCRRRSGSSSSFSPASSPTRECLVLLRSHGEATPTDTSPSFNSVLRLYRSSPLLSIRTGMLHSNPGDYAWGQGGLDAVITQVRRHKFQGVVSQFEIKKKSTSILSYLYFHQPSPTLCVCAVTWSVGKHRTPTSRKREDLFPPNCQYLSGTSRSVLPSSRLHWVPPCHLRVLFISLTLHFKVTPKRGHI